jgi:putative membrane protein
MTVKLSTTLATIWFAFLHSSFAFAQPTQPPAGPPPWDWPGHWHMWGGGGWGFWWIFPMFMFFGIVVCIAIFFFFGHRMSGGHHHGGPWSTMDRSWGDPTLSALQLLNERYARGEIQKAEYEEKKVAILSRGPR